MAYLTLQGINKIYPNGFHAVHDFNLEIEQGEFIVFVILKSDCKAKAQYVFKILSWDLI